MVLFKSKTNFVEKFVSLLVGGVGHQERCSYSINENHVFAGFGDLDFGGSRGQEPVHLLALGGAIA